jgi:hypothetical protein
MRKLLLWFGLFAGACVAAAACSSSSSNGNGGGDSGGPGPDEAGTEDTGGGFDSGGGRESGGLESGVTDSPAITDVQPHDATAACGKPPTDGGDGGDEGGATGNFAVEPNDTAQTANAIVLNVPECGAVTAADGVDFFKFTLPASATVMNVVFDGYITMKFTVGTDPPVTLTPTSFPTLPFHAGSDYVIEVHSFDGNAQVYAFTIKVM